MKDLDLVDSIRKRPGMYIGDPYYGGGLFHMLLEVLGNSLDQYFAGRLTRVDVEITADGDHCRVRRWPGYLDRRRRARD